MDLTKYFDPIIYTAVGGVIVALFNMLTTKRKIKSEEFVSISKLQSEWIEKQEEIIARQTEKIDEQDARIHELELRMDSVMEDARSDRIAYIALEEKFVKWNRGIKILIAQIERHGSRPDWRPD